MPLIDIVDILSEHVNYFHEEYKAAMLCVSAGIATLIGYWYCLGNSHSRQRKALERNLHEAQAMMRELEDKLELLEREEREETRGNKEIRLFVDGAFDMMHYGHMNAFRQAKSKGTWLIVGVNSQQSITECKGKPITDEDARIETVKACKWVDEVVENVPYVMSEEYLNWVIKEYNIDYVVHGDDPCIVDGKDVYAGAKRLGKFLSVPRTEGISTTDIVGRMLLMDRTHHKSPEDELITLQRSDSTDSLRSLDQLVGTLVSNPTKSEQKSSSFDKPKSKFLTTSLKLRLFGAGVKEPQPESTVLYVAGAWDMFHAGHIDILRQAKSMADYVIVGVHNDQVVNLHRGMNLPILNLHERVLSVLGCKYADDVLIDAPLTVSQEMLDSLRINLVLIGLTRDDDSHTGGINGSDPYKLPREKGILKTITTNNESSVLNFIDKIEEQRERLAVRYKKKTTTESQFYAEKYASNKS